MGEHLLGRPCEFRYAGAEVRASAGSLSCTQMWCQGYPSRGGSDPSPPSGPRAASLRGMAPETGRSLSVSPTWPTGASCWPAPTRSRSATAAFLTCSCRWRQQACESGPTGAHRRGVQRGVLPTTRRRGRDAVVGAPGGPNGWRVAMGTLGVERGISTVRARQMGFHREFSSFGPRGGPCDGHPRPADRGADHRRVDPGSVCLRYTARATLGPRPVMPGPVPGQCRAGAAPGNRGTASPSCSGTLPRARRAEPCRGRSGALPDWPRLRPVRLRSGAAAIHPADTIYDGGLHDIQCNIIPNGGSACRGVGGAAVTSVGRLMRLVWRPRQRGGPGTRIARAGAGPAPFLPPPATPAAIRPSVLWRTLSGVL